MFKIIFCMALTATITSSFVSPVLVQKVKLKYSDKNKKGYCNWYKFKEEDNKEKTEMEKATNSKMEYLKSLETENAHSSVTKEIINDMKKKYENTPTTSIKEVMSWLLEDKDVVYRPVHPGIPDSEAGEWLKVDPKNPILAEDYEYQLAEKTKSMWTFRVPDWHFEASSREDALQIAYKYIMENPASIVVYLGAKGDPLF